MGLTPSLPPGGPPEIPDIPGGFPDEVPFRDVSGFGEIVLFSLLGQSIPTERWCGGDIVWGIGPTFIFPTASEDELGTGKFSAGPSGVFAFIGNKFILGGFFQHWWSYSSGGKGSHRDVNFSWLNLFYFLNFKDGWQVGGTPIITANWEADSKDRWTIPVGLGLYKTSIFGKLPIKFGVEGQWMPKRPDTLGQEWNIRIVLAPIVPSPFGG